MSCPLNDLELAGMQETEAAIFYLDVCDIERPARTQQAGGGWATTYSISTAAVACAVRITKRMGQEQSSAGAIKATLYRDIHMAASVDVSDTDRIHLTAQSGAAVSRYYEVVDPGNQTDQVERFVQVKEIPHART